MISVKKKQGAMIGTFRDGFSGRSIACKLQISRTTAGRIIEQSKKAREQLQTIAQYFLDLIKPSRIPE